MMKNVEDIYPLSPTQEGMLFHSLKEPNSGVYIEQYRCVFEGDFDPALFRKAWEAIVERYSALRTVFLWDGIEKPLQVVRRTVSLDWTDYDFQKLSEKEYSQWLQEYLDDDRIQGFDLSKAPLMRFRTARIKKDTFQWLWSFHHLLSDGWSTAILLKEAIQIYRNLLRDGDHRHLRPPVPYREFIAWLQKQDLENAEDFWRSKLKNFTKPTPLPLRHSKLSQQGYGQIEIPLSHLLSTELKAFTKQYRLTLNTIIQGAWGILLYRFSGENDIIFGSTVSGRPATLDGVEEMVGLFINTLPVRVKIKPNDTLIRWLAELQKTEIETLEYSYSPLVKIQGWSDLPAGVPLFDAIVVFENYPMEDDADILISGLEIRDVHYQAYSNFPLALIVIPGDELRIIFIYKRSCYRENDIYRLFELLKTLLNGIVKDSEQSIEDLSILSESDCKLLATWQNDKIIEKPFNSVLSLFEDQVLSQSDKIAVTYNQHQINYEELNQQANRLSHYLYHQLGESGKTIGIFMNRSVEMITCILGILKFGAAYVPLDPTYPKDRLAYMVEDSKIYSVLSSKETTTTFPCSSVQIINVEDTVDFDWQPSHPQPDRIIEKGDLAYVIYTSGSTGVPKGVMINHGNLAHSTDARLSYYKDVPRDFLLLSSMSFDSSIAGIFGTLCRGGCLHIPDHEKFRDVEYLSTLIEEKGITHILSIPSLYRHMLQSFSHKLSSLEAVIVAGEPCPTDLVMRHFVDLPKTRMFNEYGPTEATVWSTVFECRDHLVTKSVPIGRPIENTSVYVLDDKRRQVPPGFPGELYIGGAGVSQGYLNQAQLTTERFFSISINNSHQNRVYKTGDLAYFSENGNLEYLGRYDEQIKVRGYRIELGEIETIIKRHPSVKDSVVVVKTNKHDKKNLLAYVVCHQETAGFETILFEFIKTKLPDYMIPSHIVVIDRMPLLANGKLNRDALPDPNKKGSAPSGGFVAPRNDLEEKLSKIWAKILDVENVGITDNFFDLGGDSLSSIRLIAEIKNQTGFNVPIDVLLRNSTIENLIKHIKPNSSPINESLTVAIQPKGDKLPLFLIGGPLMSHLYFEPDQPLYKLQTLYDDVPLRFRKDTIEKITSNYIVDLRKNFLKGPYILCGYSFGGLIALEMHRQLKSIHNETSYLFLLDPPAPKIARVYIPQNPFHTSIIAIRRIIGSIKRKIEYPFYYCMFKLSEITNISFPQKWRRQYAYTQYLSAANRYTAEPCEAIVAVCLTKLKLKNIEFDWSRLFRGPTKTYVIKGTKSHLDLVMKDDFIKIWVRYLNEFLSKVQNVN
jgi:amino acid adenylation domain-containing protein